MKLQPTWLSLAVLAVSAASASFMAFSAEAPAPAASGAVAEACRKDLQSLCPGTQPGDGRLMACMREHRAELSDGCKGALRAQRAERKPG